jgi:hypothetical protein
LGHTLLNQMYLEFRGLMARLPSFWAQANGKTTIAPRRHNVLPVTTHPLFPYITVFTLIIKR